MNTFFIHVSGAILTIHISYVIYWYLRYIGDSTLKSTLKRQVPYLVGGIITGIIMSYYYGFIVSIIINSAIWFVISTVVNTLDSRRNVPYEIWFIENQCNMNKLIWALYNNTKYNLVLSYTLSIIL